MEKNLSKRLSAILNSLPLHHGIRVLEIGCGPGALAREIAKRVGKGCVLGIDRSPKAINQARLSQKDFPNLTFRQSSIEKFDLEKGDKPFDLAIAVRVGALDGRHPDIEELALIKIAKALTKTGKLFIDGGSPLHERSLAPYRKKNK